jgi:beta-glucosidase
VCPCPKGEVLPRTCDEGSVSAKFPFCDHTQPLAARVRDLVGRLTREEKINLVTQADTGFLPRLNLKEFEFYNTCMHGWWTSNVTTFGMPVGMAASFDTTLMRQVAEVIGVEGRAMSQRDYKTSFDAATGLHGVAHNWLVCKDAAEVNMNRHPLWGRNPETYGEDPYLTATMGEAFTQQLQQPDPASKYTRTTAVTRHLVVYSGPEGAPRCKGCPARVNRFAFNANVTERDLEDYFYPPFEACLDRNRGNSKGAMCSDAAQNGVPSCASELLMTQKPKDWNASDDFFVVSDMGSYYNVFAAHKYSANTSDALLTDLQAGLDILYLRGGPQCRDAHSQSHPANCPDNAGTTQQSNETHEAFEMATNGSRPDARFTLEDLDTKAATALKIRFDLGLFDPVAGNPYAQPVPPSVIDGPAHRKVARDTTAASVVLLKNAGGLLPLSKSAKVALIGPWINPLLQPSMSHGSSAYVHAYAGTSSVMVNFQDGIDAALESPAAFAQGCESNQTAKGDPDGKFAAAKLAAAAADVVVLAVGLTANVMDAHGVGHEEEMTDRVSLELPQVQQDLIAAVSSVAKKVVLVVVSGSAVPFNESSVDAALYAMYGGAEAGNGLADVLFGDVAPSGRLPFTVFTSLDQMKPMGDYDLVAQQPGRTHLYYDDSSVAKLGAPQFWFGYGLSYTQFQYANLSLSEGPGCHVTASVTVTNVGKVAAREIAQLYLNRPAPPTGDPMAKWALKGYQRTAVLAAGASTALSFAVPPRELSTVMSDGSRTVTPGAYRVTVGGGNPRDSRVAGSVVASVDIAAGCSPLAVQ